MAVADLGFGLARQSRDPSFRQRLKAAGYRGEPMVPVTPDSTIADVLARVDGYTGPVLVCVADPACRDGWRLAWWTEQPANATNPRT